MKRKNIFLMGCLLIVGLASCSGRKGALHPPKENVFRYSWDAKLSTLDIANASDVYSTQTATLVLEPLYQFHYLKRPLEVEPLLAASLPEMSKDGKTYTFHLKKGVTFQDDPCFSDGKGREVVAEDLVYLFMRSAAPKTSFQFYGGLEGKVEGLDAYHQGKAQTISGLKVLDSHTVQIKLTQRLPRFVFNFIDPRSALVPKECVEKYKDQFAFHPVGTGPFKVIEANLGHRIVLVRNPNYKHMTYPSNGSMSDQDKSLIADAGKALPIVDKIIYEIIPERQPSWLKFISGDFEMMNIPKDNIAKVVQSGKLTPDYEKMGLKLIRSLTGDVTTLQFNVQDPVWGKKELRQAVALSLDKAKIIELQYSGQAVAAQSLIDPTMYGYDPKFESKWNKRDLVKAKALLAKAGYPDGKGLPPLKMLTLGDATSRQLDELLKRQLSEANIPFETEAMTWPEMMDRLHKHNFVMIGIAGASGVPDVDDSTGMYSSKMITSGYNSASYKNPEMDKTIDAIELMENGPARLQQIKKFREIADEDLPYIPMVHRIRNQLVHSWVKNHVFTDQMQIGMWMKYKGVQLQK